MPITQKLPTILLTTLLASTTVQDFTQNWVTCHLTPLSVNRHQKNLSNCPKLLDHYKPWPEIAALPAAAVTTEDIVKILRRITQAGKGRTANKVRSYLHSAFQVAKTSRTKASIPQKFEEFCVKHNPVADTSPDASQNQPDKDPLSLVELWMYWSLIKVMPGFKGAVLQLHLLTGGQRIAQLVRPLTKDCSGQVISDGLIGFFDVDSRSKALGDKLPSFE